MKRLILIAVFVVGLVAYSFAQNELEKEILGIKDSSEVVIRNSRLLINNRLHEHNFKDLIKIVAYAKTNIDRYGYIAFQPWEEQVLSILSEDLDYFFISATDNNFNAYAIQPKEDYMGQYAVSLILKDKETWIGWYNNLDLSDEKKQVLRIFLGDIGLFEDPMENKKITDNFIKKYPKSDYLKYANSFKNSFNYGSLEFEFGIGLWNIKNDLLSFSTPPMAFDFGMGGFSNRMYWSLYLLGTGTMNLTKPVIVTDKFDTQYTLNSGDDFSLINYGLKLGWLVCRNNWVKVYPVVNFSGVTMDLSTDDDSGEESNSLGSAFNLGAGFNADFDIVNWKMTNEQSSGQSHLGIRLSAGYQYNFSGKKYLSGSGYYSTASLVWWLGAL